MDTLVPLEESPTVWDKLAEPDEKPMLEIIMKLIKQAILSLTVMSLLAGCSGQQNAYNAQRGGITGGAGPDKTDMGTLLGAGAGAIAGTAVTHGRGKILGGVIGGLLGAGIGHEIGASLDRADMNYYQQTQQRALETAQAGQGLPWQNPQSGHSGVVIPQAPYQASDGRYCREFQNQITVGGRTERGYGTACRQPDGSWQIVSQ